MSRLVIGIIGTAGEIAPGSTVGLLEAATQVGAGIARAGAVLVSGGTTGVMAAASRCARGAGGLTIGFLPEADRSRASAFVDVAFPTGMGTIRNLLSPRVCDAVVTIGGESVRSTNSRSPRTSIPRSSRSPEPAAGRIASARCCTRGVGWMSGAPSR